MDQEFMDEIDRDFAENGPGQSPYIRLAKFEQYARELTATNRRLEAELAEARKDGERLSWMIEVSNAGMGWIEDAVWDSAPDIEGCHDVQVLIRSAIDAARGAK